MPANRWAHTNENKRTRHPFASGKPFGLLQLKVERKVHNAVTRSASPNRDAWCIHPFTFSPPFFFFFNSNSPPFLFLISSLALFSVLYVFLFSCFFSIPFQGYKQDNNHSFDVTEPVMYEIKDVPCKGKGIVATQLILKGTRIMCEKPTLQMELNTRTVIDRTRKTPKPMLDKLAAAVANLSDKDRDQFLSRPNIYPFDNDAERYHGIMNTVALPMETAGGQDAGGYFLDASLINHACEINAQKNWNSEIGRHTVHARQDIAEGEEITILYIADCYICDERQNVLLERFHFTCTCGLCSLPLDESNAMDKSLKRADDLYKKINILTSGIEIIRDTLKVLRLAHEQIQLSSVMGLASTGIASALFDAAAVCVAHGDLSRGRAFFRRAIDEWTVIWGADCSEVVMNTAFVEDPTEYTLHGLTSDWKTEVTDGDAYTDEAEKNGGSSSEAFGS